MATTAAELAVRLNARTSGLTRGLRRARRDVRRFSKAMGRVGRRLTATVTLPLAAAGAGAVKTAADFEESFSRMAGLVGVPQEQLERFEEQILALGPAVGKGPRELAEAMFFITSAGLRGQTAMDALEASAKASAAGLGDVKTVADAATSAMNAYGSEVLSANEATDILVKTVREGKVEPAELAGALGRVIPVAQQAGVSFDQVGGAIAAMTRIGLGAREATTALRSALAIISNPSKQARDVLNAVGLSAADLRKSVREDGLLAALFELQEAVAGDDEALQKLFPNVRAATGVFSLLGANAEEAGQIFESVADSTGATANAFAEASNTFKQRLAELRASAERLAIEMGEQLLPVAEDLLGTLRGITGALSKLNPQVKSLAVQTGIVAAFVGPVAIGLEKIFTFASKLVGLLPKIAAGLTSLGGAAGLTALATVVAALDATGVINFTDRLGDMESQMEGVRKASVTLVKGLDELGPTELEKRLQAIAKQEERVRRRQRSIAIQIGERTKAINRLRDAQNRASGAAAAQFQKSIEAQKTQRAFLQQQVVDLGHFANMLGEVGGAWRQMGAQAKEAGEKMQKAAEGARRAMQAGVSAVTPAGPQGPGQVRTGPLVGIPSQRTLKMAEQEVELLSTKMQVMFTAGTEAAFQLSRGFGRLIADVLTFRSSITSVGDAFRSVGSVIQRTLNRVISMLAEAALQAALLQAVIALIPGVNFIGGISSFGGFFKSALGFAHGGLAFGPTLGLLGEGRDISRSNPEVVAPLDRLSQFISKTPARRERLVAEVDMDTFRVYLLRNKRLADL